MENLAPRIVKRVAKELHLLIKEPLEGIKVTLNEEKLTEIYADIGGPLGTPYEGGSFKVKLQLGCTFPSQPPKAFFITRIFHPNVDPRNGEICVNTLKRDWNDKKQIKEILMIIRCLLIFPNPDSALNEEAANLLQQGYNDFFTRARNMTQIHARVKIKTNIKKESDVLKNQENTDNCENNKLHDDCTKTNTEKFVKINPVTSISPRTKSSHNVTRKKKKRRDGKRSLKRL